MVDNRKAAILGVAGNIFLFIIKAIAGLLSNSIAVISDAINSLTDIIASVIVVIGVKVGRENADNEHPFGHYRAEPIAGLVVAIFIGIVGFELIRYALMRLIAGEEIEKAAIAIAAMMLTIVIKLFMYIYTRAAIRKKKSTALEASAIDHRNDVVISASALAGVAGAYFGYVFLDALMALVIGVWIIWSGYSIGMTNIKYLMGENPGAYEGRKIREAALSVNGVKSVNYVKAHYVGVVVHVEMGIYVDKGLKISEAHKIGAEVRDKVKELEGVHEAFVHIDPYVKRKKYKGIGK